jgi:hypothetical protein
VRVCLTQPFRLFWNYAMHELTEGTEYIGELARHLHTTGAPVEILEHDPEPDPATAPPAGRVQEQDTTGQQQNAPDGLDIGATIDAILTWVGTDLARAQQALDAELAKGDAARATLTTRLQALLGAAL